MSDLAMPAHSAKDASGLETLQLVIVRGGVRSRVGVRLTRRQQLLLRRLAANAGARVTEQELLWLAWGAFDAEASIGALRADIARLRSELVAAIGCDPFAVEPDRSCRLMKDKFALCLPERA